MTRKDYEAIAAVICERLVTSDISGLFLSDFVNDMADYFMADNPRFDRGRFLEACGID